MQRRIPKYVFEIFNGRLPTFVATASVAVAPVASAGPVSATALPDRLCQGIFPASLLRGALPSSDGPRPSTRPQPAVSTVTLAVLGLRVRCSVAPINESLNTR